MRTPRVLKIAHATFAIRSSRQKCDEEDADGFFSAAERQIVYRPGFPVDRRREVLLHEAIHACVEVSRGLNLSEEEEEVIVDALTGPLLDLIQNPDFVAFLTQSGA